MIKVLVTGSNGQLGSQLQNERLSYPDVEFMYTDLQEMDITNVEAVESIFSSFKPDWLINCAGYTAVDKAEAEPEKAMLLNANAPAMLALTCTRHGARMIHVSTDYVFDGKGYMPYSENYPKNPQGVYAKTKSLGEDMVISNDPNSIVVRTSWLYSIYGGNFVKTVLRLAREKGTMKIVSDQVGTPTWTGDLANALMIMVTSSFKPGVYHYSNEGVCSWYDFAKAIAEIKAINCTINPTDTQGYPLPAPRPYYSVLDKSKFKNTSRNTIPYWRDSLKQCLQLLNE
jgi:dTDP-4-dehydrorhamnose reductase